MLRAIRRWARNLWAEIEGRVDRSPPHHLCLYGCGRRVPRKGDWCGTPCPGSSSQPSPKEQARQDSYAYREAKAREEHRRR